MSRHLLTVIFFLASGLVLLYVATGALGQAVTDSHYSVTLNYDGRLENISTDLHTVGELLESLDITLGPLDVVEPIAATAIDRDSFPITVHRGRYVRVIDDDEQALEVTAYIEPREIVTNLNYELHENDMADWRQSEPLDSLSMVPTVVIERANNYELNIDGEVVATKAQATSVGGILAELGHGTEGIAYIRPSLSQIIKDDDSIVVYYDQPNQEIVIEDRIIYGQGGVTHQEIVYQIIYDSAGRIKERNVIERYDIPAPPPDSRKAGEIVSTSHLVGDLNDQQKAWLRAANVAEVDWYYVDYIIFRESRWNPTIWNMAGSSAYGLCQALPASKMATAGADYMSNPVTQLKWCDQYAHDRYGGWKPAYDFWQNNHWW